jgi:DNA modification methylase
MMTDYQLYHGDCLEYFDKIAPQSVDAVICDPPYGTTACKWDSVIPFEPMWAGIKRVLKPRGACVLFARGSFSFALGGSNIKNYKYKWVWDKKLSGSFQNAAHQPLQIDEDILVFGFGSIDYHPQMRAGILRFKGGHNGSRVSSGLKPFHRYLSDQYYPTNILNGFHNANRLNKDHPTQKPLALLEYLVRTYTNEGDTVLDFAFGSGTTGAACGNLGRRFIGIEKDKAYFDLGSERIATAYAPLRMMQAAI